MNKNTRSLLRIAPRIMLGLVLIISVSHATTLPVPPHEATYRTTFKGIGVGDLQVTLSHDATTDLWTYETRAQPNVLARLMVSPQSVEQSVFRATANGIAPIRYHITDGSSRAEGAAALSYDEANHHVTGQVKGIALDLPFEGALTDPLSIRAAVLFDLNAGRTPTEYAMIDNKEIKHYTYHFVRAERANTALGSMDTVVYESERAGAQGHGRSWRFWYAPALHHVIVRAEQRDDGHIRLLMTIHSIHWKTSNSSSGPIP
jgi:hypothetical protein